VRKALAVLVGAAVCTVAVGVADAVNGPPSNSSTGSGQVFFPNPVAQLQNQSLTDQKDADYAALAPAYRTVTLTNLDGSGFLVGDYANVLSETGDPAFSSTNSFIYRRNDDRFEQVMGYYWVTQAQLYIQSLGFGSGKYRPVNKESQDLRINTYGVDNSFSWDKKDLLRFGKGGVDDAEDAEVILHEYGHAVHDAQVPGFGSSLERGRADSGRTLRRGLGRGLLHLDRAALPAAGRSEPALPRGRAGRSARGRPDLVSRSLGHPAEARPREGRHDHPRGTVLVCARHIVQRRSVDDDRDREAALRKPGREGRPRRLCGSWIRLLAS
jgi:hypothetical protein